MAQAFPPKPNERERALRDRLSRAPRPKIAATLILYRGGADNFEVLMGQRAANHDFMPSIYVFPGGQIDRADSYVPFLGHMPRRAKRILARDLDRRHIEAPALAAIRETFEETGLMLGSPQSWPRQPNDQSWMRFYSAQVTPDISAIRLVGRAITPPNRHKRFDTWFFALPYNGDPSLIHDSNELIDVGWRSAADYKKLSTHHVTNIMFDTFRRGLGQAEGTGPILFSRQIHGRYEAGPYPEPS